MKKLYIVGALIGLSCFGLVGSVSAHNDTENKQLGNTEFLRLKQFQSEKKFNNMQNTANKIETRFEKLLEKIRNNKRLDDASKAELIKSTSDRLTELKTLRANIKAPQDQSDVKNFVQSLREQIKTAKKDVHVKVKTGLMVRFETALTNVLEKIKLFKEAIAKADAQGKDTKNATQLLTKCESAADRAVKLKEKNFQPAIEQLKHCYQDFTRINKILSNN